MYRLCLVFVVCLASMSAVVASDDKQAAAGGKKAAATDAKKAGGARTDGAKAAAAPADFDTLYKEWKELLARFKQIRNQFQTDVSADKKALETEAQAIVYKVRDMMEPLTAAGLKKYIAAPNKDDELTDFLVGALNGFMVADDYEIAARICKIMLDNHCERPEVQFYAGIAYFMTNDFDAAEKQLQLAKEKKLVNENTERYLGMIGKYKELWKQENAIREAEEKAGDLPKVKLTTTQGEIVVVLYENEAPNTVANFVNLVENKYYDGLAFHRVIPGFMAQGGDPKGDGTGGPGYTIPDECRQENHRNHFRGSLSMAKTSAPDTGGSQFYMTFAPTSHLDGAHTVFGRVVEGMRVLGKLQRTEGIQGKPGPVDKILKAEVISKRPHEYKPIKRLDESN